MIWLLIFCIVIGILFKGLVGGIIGLVVACVLWFVACMFA